MSPNKSLDDSYNIIAALILDVGDVRGLVYNIRSLRLDLLKVKKRLQSEGMGFLTKTLPRLGKCLDKALAEHEPFDCQQLSLKPSEVGGKLPKLFGELFKRVFKQDGTTLPNPCTKSVRSLRDICYIFYKYELPYDESQEVAVVEKFVKTDSQLPEPRDCRATDSSRTPCMDLFCTSCNDNVARAGGVLRRARDLLSRLLLDFDPYDIQPRHGPGAVSTKEKPWDKYVWTNVSDRITRYYPFDEFFSSSLGSVCDSYKEYSDVTGVDHPARVVLVPKDSRGPRLISCEPVDFQWIQQGLGRGLVSHVENHPLTRWNVFFTDQGPNRRGAELGSKYGTYATLDLNEASDRVSLELVRRLFPPHICEYLEACRSGSTVLPSGRTLNLKKFAPMGSALCFPVLALVTWAVLTAGASDADTKDRILVYGDDVVVPTAYAADAMKHLESVGLKINRDKSCTKGLFRESCGMDSFRGVNVTPVRFRTVWSSLRQANVYTSYIAYANALYDKQYYRTYDFIVRRLISVYTEIPDDSMNLSCPSLRWVPLQSRPRLRRLNTDFQKVQYRAWDTVTKPVTRRLNGWSMLLRYFSEQANLRCGDGLTELRRWDPIKDPTAPRSVSQYTRRDTSMLVKRWR